MTDAETGSVAQLDAPAGNPPPQTQAPDNGSPGASATSWLEGLSEGNRKLAENKGWTTPESLDKAFTSYAEMERMQGDALRVPKQDATPEEWDKFYSKLGRPETADKYEYKRPEGLPPDLPYTDELATASKSWMHGAGLTPNQAQSVHDNFVKFMTDQHQARAAQLAQAVESTHDELVKEVGGPADSPVFKEYLEMANRGMKKLGWEESLKKVGVLLPDGSLTDPQIARGLKVIGEIFREDTIDPGGGAPSGDNPFKRDEAGKIRSISAISAQIKSDPDKARRLAREAGEPIERWFPSNPR